MQNKWNRSTFFLLAILFLAFVVRLYRFNSPIADWHSWRQADTSAVSRNFITKGFDIFHPTFDDLSNVPSGIENPNGYRYVEFPIYNIAQAGLYKLVGILTIEEWGRILTISSSLLTIVFLYALVSKRINKTAGILTALFFAFLPFSIYYGRTILPDTSMSMTIIGGIYFFERSFKDKVINKKMFFLAMLFTACSFLLKPYALIFTLPMVITSYEVFGIGLLKKWQLYFFVFITMLPFIMWRKYITQFPEGIPSSSWLLNGNGIRFRPAFFRWIVYERLARLISGYTGIIILVIGISFSARKKQLFFLGFLLSSVVYISIFATGNVQHDYYQILILPTLSIFFGIGSYYLLSIESKFFPKRVSSLILFILIAVSFFFSWRQVKDYFNVNNPSIVIAGEVVDRLTPKNAKIIANYEGDTSFLYQTKRQGWASFEHPLPDMIKLGASYLVLANPTPQDLAFSRTYKVIAKSSQYVIFDLHQKP